MLDANHPVNPREETPQELAVRIGADPDSVSDADKLRSIANFLDALEIACERDGHRQRSGGTAIQDFVRGLALRIDLVGGNI